MWAIYREGLHAKTIGKTPGLVRDHLRRVVADLLRGGLFPKAGLQVRAGYVIDGKDEEAQTPPKPVAEAAVTLTKDIAVKEAD